MVEKKEMYHEASAVTLVLRTITVDASEQLLKAKPKMFGLCQQSGTAKASHLIWMRICDVNAKVSLVRH
jgi:hypothetical protein